MLAAPLTLTTADGDEKFVDGVIDVHYDPHQAVLCCEQARQRKPLPGCVYSLWSNLKGRGKGGEFALTIARHFFNSQGYEVLVSDSQRENPECFILASYPGLRKQRPVHPAYQRMVDVFGEAQLLSFNERATREKLLRKRTRNAGGGDPDLFVRCRANPNHYFFAEVKYKDRLPENQKAVFPLISEKLRCKVFLVQIRPILAQNKRRS